MLFHPKSGKEILIFFPFTKSWILKELKKKNKFLFFKTLSKNPFKLYLTNCLGSTNPYTITVHMGPFSTSAQKILIFVLATTTKICTIEKSN